MTSSEKTPEHLAIHSFIKNYCLEGNIKLDHLVHRLDKVGLWDFVNKSRINDGFPYKSTSALDECILLLHYFLYRKICEPDSHLLIHSIHVPFKEEEKTLSFWKSAKAGLYLDLQALLLNKKLFKNSVTIQRLFVFRTNLQVALVEADALTVILEQQRIGIDTGFIIEAYNKQYICILGV